MKLITKVTDEDIGEEIVEMKEPIYRKAARGIVLDEQGNMAVFYKENKNMYKLPGGGLEENVIEKIKKCILEYQSIEEKKSLTL